MNLIAILGAWVGVSVGLPVLGIVIQEIHRVRSERTHR